LRDSLKKILRYGYYRIMNIFILDQNPVVAAQSQCDKHVVKMIVESAQMLSTAHRMIDGVSAIVASKSGKRMVNYYRLDDDREDVLYKAVHHNHPCTIWTQENAANYQWHYRHFIALCSEYTYRYGRIHKSFEGLANILRTCPSRMTCSEDMTPFRLAMGDSPESIRDDAVEAYRHFYQTKQRNFKMVWSRRDTPAWFQYVL
jgi:hypothetical protein